MKNKNWIDEWVTQYGTEGKLPSKTIPCSTEGCTTETTCFSTNLSGKITSTEGGLPTLLRTFKCRGCRSKTSGVVEKPKLARVAKSTKKTTTKKEVKETKVEALKEAARSFVVDPNRVSIKYNFNDPESVRQLTEGTCQRPDIYLNNDRACDGCVLYEHCACASKQLLAATGRKALVTGPRRKK
jgi:hypothetical protein